METYDHNVNLWIIWINESYSLFGVPFSQERRIWWLQNILRFETEQTRHFVIVNWENLWTVMCRWMVFVWIVLIAFTRKIMVLEWPFVVFDSLCFSRKKFPRHSGSKPMPKSGVIVDWLRSDESATEWNDRRTDERGWSTEPPQGGSRPRRRLVGVWKGHGR